MNLLPRSHSEFHSPAYWDEFFKKRGTKAFEWYGEYPELCGILHKYIKTKDKLLVVGCGNSQLSENMYDVGYHDITNIDISDIVINQMNDKNKHTRPDMKFLKMDVMQMEIGDGEFSAVLDKGTLDALMVDDSESVVTDIEKMFTEIGRILKQGGRYICISLLQEHIMNKVLEFFQEIGWPIRVHRVMTETSGNTDKEFVMPTFAVVFTKFRKLPNMKPILEVVNHEDKVERYENAEKFRKVLKEMQYYAMIRQQIGKRSMAGEQVSLSLYSEASTTAPRYTLHIVDSAEKLLNKFAIFIVPEGRECEWMFTTEAGRIQLSESAKFSRLIVVTLHRDHTYCDLESIKSELSQYVLELSPPGFKTGVQVPFLSIGEDKGKRTIQHRGTSDMTGDYVVEDVDVGDGQMYRRLIFMSRCDIIQSEARLKQESRKKGKKGKLVIDKSYLSCQHHVAMVAGLGFTKSTKSAAEAGDRTQGLRTLLVGMGGGGLATFIHNNFPKILLGVVDIDPAVVQIAQDWFGFTQDSNMKVYVADGLQYIQDLVKAGSQVDVVMFDVDSKDTSVGMSCPPDSFVSPEFLAVLKQALHPQGVFILNLVCRDAELKKDVMRRLGVQFEALFMLDIEDEVNQIVYALPEKQEDKSKTLKTVLHHIKDLNTIVQRKTGNNSVANLCCMTKNLSIVDG